MDITGICTAGRAYRPPLSCGSIGSCLCLHLSQTPLIQSKNVHRFPVSSPPPYLLTLLKANKPTQCRLKEECRVVGTPESLCSTPCSKQGYLGSSIKCHRTFSREVFEGLQRWIFCSLGCNSLTQGLSSLGNFFFPIPRQLCPCSNLLAPVLFLCAPLRRVCLLCGSLQVFEGKKSIPSACSFLCCTTLGPYSGFSPGCQDWSCPRRPQIWTQRVPDEASRAAEPRAQPLPCTWQPHSCSGCGWPPAGHGSTPDSCSPSHLQGCPWPAAPACALSFPGVPAGPACSRQ